MQKVNFFDIPMGTIEDIKVEKMTTTAGATELKVKLVTKDIRTIVWVLSQDGDLQALLDAVKARVKRESSRWNCVDSLLLCIV